jgi:methylated-DNA-[protein]-cysteine S-methyltransferase
MGLFCAVVTSPVGTWGVEGDGQAIARIYMPNEFIASSRGTPPAAVALGVEQLNEYFAGERRRFRLPLAEVPATEFQRDVWAALRAIPYGEVRTYGDVAAAVGRPLAARAVGNANHANPWPIIVPCHRVVASHGLGGYGGGEKVKRFLLGVEGAVVA